MAYKQSPGRMNMPKTGRGVDAPTLMKGSPAHQSIIDADNDGDTVFNDSNNDGTMASRAFDSVKKMVKKGAASSDYAAGKLRASEKRRNAAATSDFKKVFKGEMNAIDAIKKHFPMN